MTKIMSAMIDDGLELYRRDARFAALTQSAVNEAMREYGWIDPEHAQRAAHDIAGMAVVVALKRAFDGDAELTVARQLLEQYKKLATDVISMSPGPVVIRDGEPAL